MHHRRGTIDEYSDSVAPSLSLSLDSVRSGWIVCESLAWRAYWPKILASWQSTLSVLSHLLCKKRKSVNTSDNRGMPNAIAQNELNCSELAQKAVWVVDCCVFVVIWNTDWFILSKWSWAVYCVATCTVPNSTVGFFFIVDSIKAI